MAARVAIIVLIAAARSLFWVLEQPKGSLFELHPMMQKVFALITVHRKSINMGSYGAPSLKPTWLYSGPVLGAVYKCVRWVLCTCNVCSRPLNLPSTHHAITVGCFWRKCNRPLQTGHGGILNEIDHFQPPNLPDNQPAALVKHYVDGKGKQRITGSSSLKSSQSYPLGLLNLMAALVFLLC